LPDLGPYNCFLQNWNAKQTHQGKITKDGFTLLNAENLLLYNPRTQEIKIITIGMTHIESDSHADHYRFFYIHKNGSISLYEVVDDESISYFRKSQSISVDKGGKISIDNLK